VSGIRGQPQGGQVEVGGDDEGLGFVGVGDDFEEETSAVLVDGEVAEFVEDEELGAGEFGELAVEAVTQDTA